MLLLPGKLRQPLRSRSGHRDSPSLCRYSSTYKSTRSANARRAVIGEAQRSNTLMEVTKDNFAEALPVIQEALEEASFYAFDCEMTGLFVSENRNGLAEGKPPAYLHDVEDRYEELLQSSSAFVVNQFGLSVFAWDEALKSYAAKTFNFYTFPRPFEEYAPRFLSEAGSLQFLSEHNFDFNKWIYHGIPYMPGSLRDKKLKALADEQRKRTERNERGEIVPSTEVDKMLVADLIKDVRAWLSGEEAELLLSPVNSYQRALQYQELRKDQFGCEEALFPGFYPEKVEIEGTSRALLKLVRATGEEIETREREMAEARRQAVLDAAGFASVLDAMRECSKPAVGHNLAFDVAYSIHSFVSPLPASWEEFRGMVMRQFPGGIFDTKLISQYMLKDKDPDIDTTLGPLYATLMEDHEGLVTHAAGYDMYRDVGAGEAAHDAGYDAFMTGAAFACMSIRSEKNKEAAGEAEEEEEGQIEGDADDPMVEEFTKTYFPAFANQMYVTGSDLAYASFSGPQDYPTRDNIVYVKDIPPNQQVRRGNDLARTLGKRNPALMGSRVTTLEYGSKALIEFQDADAAKSAGMEALKELFEDATVAEYATFREERRERLVQYIGGGNSGSKRRKSSTGAGGEGD